MAAEPDTEPVASAELRSASGIDEVAAGGKRGGTSLLTVALTLAALTVAAVGLHAASSIVGPAFFALTLVVSARPLQSWLIRKGWHPVLSATAVLLALYTLLAVIVVGVIVAIAQLSREIPKYTTEFRELYEHALSWLVTFGVDETAIDQIVASLDVGSVVRILRDVLASVSAGSAQVALIVVVMFFLAIDMASVSSRWAMVTNSRPDLAMAMQGFVRGVRKYWLVSSIFGLIVAVLDVVALAFIGVPLVLTWGVLSFVTNYIPNIGFVIGLVPPAILALLHGGVTSMVWVIIAYTIINFTIQSLIQPKFTGDAVGLSPVITFISLVLWALVLGPLGALLAVPLTLFFKALFVDANPDSRWFNAFLMANEGNAKPAKPAKPGKLSKAPAPPAAPSAEGGPTPPPSAEGGLTPPSEH